MILSRSFPRRHCIIALGILFVRGNNPSSLIVKDASQIVIKTDGPSLENDVRLISKERADREL